MVMLGVARYAARKVKLHQKYTAKQLYIQLSYLDSLFDIARADRKLVRLNNKRKKDGLQEFSPQVRSVEHKEDLDNIKKFDTGALLQWSKYHWIESEVFRSAFSLDKKGSVAMVVE